MQLIRLAQVLFLTSLPMQFLTDAPLENVIVGAGLFVGLYTIVGGIETVVWADAIRALVEVAGGILCVICWPRAGQVLPESWRLAVHSYWVGGVVNVVFVAIAYGVALFRRRSATNLSGLTIWT